jgi:hypothetical protein
LAAAALWDGRYSDAIEADAGYSAQAFFYLDEPERAITMLAKKHSSNVNGRRSDGGRASFLAALGRKAEAQELLSTLISTTYKDHHLAYSIGAAYAQLGDLAEAVRWLRKAVGEGFACYPWYARDKLLKPLSGDAEFQRMMQQMRIKWEENKARYRSKTEAP